MIPEIIEQMRKELYDTKSVSYTHLRAHET